MSAWPVIERELRVRARSGATYWFRPAAATVGALIGLPMLFLYGAMGSGNAIGSSVFNGIVGIAFIMCCGSCVLTADCLSSERREGTLGLLLTTRLKPSDVVLGKLGSIGMNSFFALVAFLPVLMIPVMAGGVTAGEAVRKGLALMNALFFSLALGLWVSSGGGHRLQVARNAMVLEVMILVMPWMFWSYALLWLPRQASRGVVAPALALALFPVFVTWLVFAGVTSYLAGPLGTLFTAGDVEYKSSQGHYWISLALVHFLSWVVILAAGFRLRVSSRDDLESWKISLPEDERWEFWPARPKKRLGDSPPIEWLVRQQRGLKGTIWAGTILGIFGLLFPMFGLPLLAAAGWMSFSPITVSRRLTTSTTFVTYQVWWSNIPVMLLQSTLFAWAASRFLMVARQTGELELLETTPLGARTILSGLWKQLWRHFRWPAIILGSLPLVSLILALSRFAIWPHVMWSSVILNMASAFLNAFFGVMAICWLGMSFGLTARNQAGAITWAVLLGYGAPYLLGSLSSFALISLGLNPNVYINGGGLSIIQWLPRLLPLALLVWLIYWAQARLRAALPGAEPAGFLPELVQAIRRARHWTPAVTTSDHPI